MFRKFYDNNRPLFEEAKNTYIRAIKSLIKQSDVGEVTKIEGRVKNKDYLSELIGIRIVCLYEDQLAVVSEVLKGHFKNFEFEDYKVDNFVQDILKLENGFKRSDPHKSLIENLQTVRDYRDDFMVEKP